jgi:hypothetical protein
LGLLLLLAVEMTESFSNDDCVWNEDSTTNCNRNNRHHQKCHRYGHRKVLVVVVLVVLVVLVLLVLLVLLLSNQ